MKRNIMKKTMSVILTLALVVALVPKAALMSQAEESKWTHMSTDEANATATHATYDKTSDTITFTSGDDSWWSWANRMQYRGLADVSGKNYAIEFNVSVDGGLIGVYNYESSGSMYGVYLDTNAAQLDRLQFTDWGTCVDDFNFREGSTEGATVHDNIQAFNWNGALNEQGSRLRVEFLCGAGGTYAGGTVNYYKLDTVTGEYLLLGSVSTPDNVEDNPELQNYFGIQLWLGNGTVSNITFEPDKWVHMSVAENAAGNASYDKANDVITFKESGDWSNRMQYTGIADVSKKDYVVEFDLAATGGVVGVFNYENSGSMYGVYLDVNSTYLDAVQFSDWTTCVDDFWFRESTTEGATIHATTQTVNWAPGTDKNNAHIRVEFLRGANGTLAGGQVNYYKKDVVTGNYYFIGSVATPANVADNANLPNYFGIQQWIGSGTVSNITVQEYTPVKTTDWVHLNENEANATLTRAAYDAEQNTITFVQDDLDSWNAWASRMKYNKIADASRKNYAIEFDVAATGGLIGVFNYEDTGSLYGVYLDTGAGQLDRLQFTDWITCVDDFNFRETSTAGAVSHGFVQAANWNGAGNEQGTRLRVEFWCGASGTYAGGTVEYYKKDATTGQYVHMGSVTTPDNVADDINSPNYFGIQQWIGSGVSTISNIAIEEICDTELVVGGGDTKTTAVKIGVNAGETLPTKCYVDGKYIIGWTVDGVAQTTYDASIPSEKYVADFVDTKMLQVKVQDNCVVAGTEASTYNARFIASVNALPKYKSAGMVFSLSNSKPTVGGPNSTVRSTTTVYTALNVRYSADGNGTSVPVGELYDAYSTHMFACEMSGIPNQEPAAKIYARAYVELQDGTIVYGETRHVSVPE